MKSMAILVSLFVLAAVIGLNAGPAGAQSIFLEPNNGAAIHLEALRPNFSGDDFSNLTFTFFLSMRANVGGDLFVRTELPFSNYKQESYYYDEWGNYVSYGSSNGDTAFGNPYIGLDAGRADNGFQGEFGVRLPVVNESSSAISLGSITDVVERMEAFTRDMLPIYLGVNYRLKTDNGFGMRLRMAPVFWMWIGDRSRADNDIFLLYSAQAWYESGKVGVGGGFSGRFLATGEANGFGERSFHQFGFFANYSFGKVMPGFQVRFPLDYDLRRYGMNPSYSLSIGYKL